MAEYINREYLLDAMQAERERLRPLYDNYALGFEKGILLVKGFPCADVVPVVHGRWLLDGRCSECLENPLSTHKNYCPNCGARMDLEEQDGKG